MVMKVDITALPSLGLEDRKLLPRESGIYFVTGGDGALLYVGTSVDIGQRWLSHHVTPVLLSLDGVRIAWMSVPPNEDRATLERALIKELCPSLNVVGVPRLGRLPARQSEYVTVNVRLPEDIHRELTALAAEEDRSLNGEIVYAVRQYIAARRRPPQPSSDYRYGEASEHRATGRLVRAAEPPADRP
jgi:hypothetical protein